MRGLSDMMRFGRGPGTNDFSVKHAKVNVKLPLSISTTAMEVMLRIYLTFAFGNKDGFLCNIFQNIF
jgi:hypothetical protein